MNDTAPLSPRSLLETLYRPPPDEPPIADDAPVSTPAERSDHRQKLVAGLEGLGGRAP